MLTIDAIKTIFSKYKPRLREPTPHTAAVMVLLLQTKENNIEIVITERAATLPTYAGQYSLPGGMHDEEDKNLLVTAQRELYEELNIPANAYQFIGQLDDFPDRYGNLVRPFVISMSKEIFLALHKVSQAEINSIYFFPLSQLHEFKDNPDLYQITRRRPSYSFTFEHVFVWGLTAAILVRFSELLGGNIYKW